MSKESIEVRNKAARGWDHIRRGFSFRNGPGLKAFKARGKLSDKNIF
jgi:hypothetical protein